MAGNGEILELLDLQFRELKLPNIQISQDIFGPEEGRDDKATHYDEISANLTHQRSDAPLEDRISKRIFPVSNRALSALSNKDDSTLGEQHTDEVWRRQVDSMECSFPSTLTVQANLRTAKILAFLHRPKVSQILNRVAGGSESGFDHQQASSIREKEWSDLFESWEHSRGW